MDIIFIWSKHKYGQKYLVFLYNKCSNITHFPYYKNLWWLWGADWKFWNVGNCSASRGLPSDAEQLSWVTGFSIRTKQTLWITLPSTIAFRLEYILVYQFYAEITIFFQTRNVWFGSYLQDLDVETIGRKWWQHDVKTCKMTSKHHNRRPNIIHVSRLTLPHVRRHFLAPVGFREIPVGYARKDLSAPVKSRKSFLLHTR